MRQVSLGDLTSVQYEKGDRESEKSAYTVQYCSINKKEVYHLIMMYSNLIVYERACYIMAA